ncbi:MAG: phage head closure protein [Clostridia bacterium]|nr:phage head closure protein [Clostridia bacterium]
MRYKRLSPGDLTRKVRIQRKAVTGKDALNADIIDWVDVATVWAEVIDLSGREFFASQQFNAETTTRVRIWYRPGIDATMRVLDGSRILPLVSPPIDPEGRKWEWVLMCKEAV